MLTRTSKACTHSYRKADYLHYFEDVHLATTAAVHGHFPEGESTAIHDQKHPAEK